jgi:hypothetical protein
MQSMKKGKNSPQPLRGANNMTDSDLNYESGKAPFRGFGGILLLLLPIMVMVFLKK